MPKYRVIAEFLDSHSGKRLKPGDEVEATKERVKVLKAAGVVGDQIDLAPPSNDLPTKQTDHIQGEQKPDEDPEDDSPQLKPLGGGYYELPDGRKIQGKKAALEALAESGGEDGAKTGNSTADGTNNPPSS